jgi:toxin ParE1/3/4
VTLQIVVSREARADITEAVVWLRKASPSLPRRFRLELETAYAVILEHPEVHPIVHKHVRRALLHRFPYSVFYLIEPPGILIVGVVHQARDEAIWKQRS